MKKIYLAGGCFWGVQAYFKTIKGIIKTTVGYANSEIKNPTYIQVKTGSTNAVEAVEIYYDEIILKLDEIVKKLFDVIDPTQLNHQAHDFGSQYRNGFYFENEEDELIINNKINELSKHIKGKVVTEVLKLKNYYLAEEYHQDYLDKHPNAYCHINF
ncbi:peptide-methionine (S)-S-oxide reductase MsrA [Mycoplasma crocodyli]|uniref:Peptide methionine sulfoxide reductase MsrA n=1 Tax=Mycoplasma crocodyli (strain ATCC 51981 / MP145) TaxID=512564 RepID=D5E617_MYCCM|nr:peptide-methionine (S)-S-oxide reductase MsrA [Mycoplasma crocodyli]ADE19594.1 methionine-S-sulfoxide reductase A [Mycoplasma crocodyli MP145]